MSGNVSEWCQDIYKSYPCDNTASDDGPDRVYRGGSCFYLAQICRAAYRDRVRPTGRGDSLGFRLALSLQ